MTTQPEALRLIQHLKDNYSATWDGEAISAELRRLHVLNQDLLEALQTLDELADKYAGDYPTQVGTIARAAIAKATGGAA